MSSFIISGNNGGHGGIVGHGGLFGSANGGHGGIGIGKTINLFLLMNH